MGRSPRGGCRGFMQMSLHLGCSSRRRQGAAAPTLRICCALPPTFPVELARKCKEQVTGARGRRGASRPSFPGCVEWAAGSRVPRPHHKWRCDSSPFSKGTKPGYAPSFARKGLSC